MWAKCLFAQPAQKRAFSWHKKEADQQANIKSLPADLQSLTRIH
jgi:hypothetical protein